MNNVEENIKITKILKDKNCVEYSYEMTEDLKKYINMNKMKIEYDENIEEVPDSILVIPFICNILPIIWILDAKMYVDELDKEFYESIEMFKQGYKKMYPNLKFKGSVNVKKIIYNEYEDSNKCLCFFSGGVDATSTLITHINDNPVTLTLWGADIKTENTLGWEKTKNFIIENTPNINNNFVKSEFRDIINEKNLNSFIKKYVSENWWHGFQHGIGLIGHAAPLCYLFKIKKTYIPSTFTKDDVGITCASDPTIDNKVRFGNTKVYHDGFELSRQDKIERICNYNRNNNNKFKLRVCYITDKGNNCNECEKCIRTIMGIQANDEKPEDYGFSPDYKKIKKIMENDIYFDNIIMPLWENILNKFYSNWDTVKANKDINWILDVDLNKINKHFLRIDKKIIRVLKRIYKRWIINLEQKIH